MTFANRQLQSELTDAQTNLVLMKGDFAAIKQQFNEKAHELEMLVYQISHSTYSVNQLHYHIMLAPEESHSRIKKTY